MDEFGDRLNAEGLRRDQLKWALKTPRLVERAIQIDRCLLCRRDRVNEAGLCRVCWPMIDDAERKEARKWLTGEMPA